MNDKKHQLRKLWDICFSEDKAFSDLYFEMHNIEKDSVFIERDGQIVSAMQLLPYSFNFCGHNIPIAYISGACTHPDYRCQGIMGELITKAFHHLYDRHIPLVCLIPATATLFDYYSKFGFCDSFTFSIEKIDSEITKDVNAIDTITSENLLEAYQYFNTMQMVRNCYVAHSFNDFSMIVKDMEMNHLPPVIVKQNNKISGMAFPYQVNGETIIKELMYSDNRTKETLLAHFRKGKLIKMGKDCRLGMIRIVDSESILDCYAKTQKNLSTAFHLTDNLISENCGDYAIRGEIVKKRDFILKMNMDITTLTQGLFGSSDTSTAQICGFKVVQSFMSLMMD